MTQQRLQLVRTSPTGKAKRSGRSLAKGLAAGLIGGIAAVAARSLTKKVYPPHSKDHPELPHSQSTGHALALRKKISDSPALHWGIGAAAGAAYGAVAEYYPQATSKDGASFGMTLAALSQDGALAAIGLHATPSDEQTTRERSSAMASFVVFGVVTETVRRIVRPLLK